MKRLILTILTMAIIASETFAQDLAQQGLERQISQRAQANAIELPTFDLDFPGGTPQQLVEAIRAEIETLNAIIPTEHKDVKLPPLKMRDVNVEQLFKSLEMASLRRFPDRAGPVGNFSREVSTRMGFQMTGPLTPESVWYFYVQKPQEIERPKIVAYYQLGRYLAEYKIDDITTAIQAGWDMLEETDAPKLKFHEDTKLLIAVGGVGQVNMIQLVLKELDKGLKAEPEQPPSGTVKPPSSPRPQ